MRAPQFHGNVVVSNLPEGFTAVELASLFDDFGLVLGAEMDRRRARQGSIILAPEPAVAKAIEALHGQTLAERKLKVVRAPAPVKKPKPANAAPRTPRPAPAAAAPEVPREPLRPRSYVAPDQIADAIRRFRGDDAPAEAGQSGTPAGAPRQVVVEYRKTRRIELPPRAAAGARG
jgi:RNA recognition motif-containing protein